SPLKLLKLASDGIFAFSIVPIRASALLGAASICLSMLYAIYALGAKVFLNRSPQGFTALILVITLFSGVILLFLGVIGEYVGRIYEETKARPLYVIAKCVGRSDRMGTEGSSRETLAPIGHRESSAD